LNNEKSPLELIDEERSSAPERDFCL